MDFANLVALDIVIGVAIIWSMFNGFRKGLIIKVASIVSLFLGVYAGFHFSSTAANWLNGQFDWSARTLEIGAFVLTFLAVVIGVHFLARVLEKVVDLTALSLVNKLGGMLMGLIQGILFLSVLTYALNGMLGPRKWLPAEQVESSVLYPEIESAIEYLIPEMNHNTPWEQVRDRLEEGMEGLEEGLEEAVESSGLTRD